LHDNSRLIFLEHVAARIPKGARVLEFAGDTRPSTFCMATPVDTVWETADLASEAGVWVDDANRPDHLMPSEYEVPVDAETFDVVLSGQVIEHVREPWTWMRELARITRPGGQVITINPISWPFHEAPIDCWRIYPDGMKALSDWAGLDVEFSWWGSLEPSPRRSYPGEGRVRAQRQLRRRVKQRLGLATPVAYDLVTVARKPPAPS
jgi:SAM-dependent methyltransferase